MSNLAVLPIVIPLLSGIIAAFFHKKIILVRFFSKFMIIFNLLASVWIGFYIMENGSVILETGDWKAPYGIILVADQLSIILVITTNVIASLAVFYARSVLSERKEHYYFYTFFFLLISGVSGAFLTGDLFNLFVFYEVFLMASYALIVLGGEKIQLRESFKYVILNLFSSMLFVTTVAFLYSVVGTVNLAQIAERVQDVEQKGILTTIGILLFFVFASKAAIFPLYYWMPKSYIVPNPVVSALFGALLTKVGIYSILRVFSLIFVHEPMVQQLFLWLAGLSMIFGVIGALSTYNVKLIIVYNIIPAVGFMLMGIGLLSETGYAGAVYYLVHDMIIKAALFMLIGLIVYRAGTSDLRKMGGLLHRYPLLGWTFFISSLVLAGIPPFSGFIGKLLLLQAGFEKDQIMLVLIGLGSSLLILLSMIRIFIHAFWGEEQEVAAVSNKPAPSLAPSVILVLISVILGAGAEWFYPFVEDVSNMLADRDMYINSVLKE
ncbi:Na+/H+ antiporter subunit D [Melghiribacillus thermohalophilus]|uniref:Na+/H+ antiporter subunit D n=1 Tax=Melghiribacillus thermohalophilus TaxID=1324956 RepID=UPI00104FC8F5|nr:Na+/H+ antiporter subunit D [Melghiribacillus thermohalophilus]